MIYIEKFRLRSIVHLLSDGLFIFNSKRPLENVFYFESSQRVEKLLPLLRRLFKIDIKKLCFKHTRFDNNGTLLGFWVIFHELNQMRIKFSNDPLYRALLSQVPQDKSFPLFFNKSIFTTGSNRSSNFEPTTFERLLIMLNVVRWHGKSSHSKTIVFYIIERCWMDLLQKYAKASGILLIPTKRSQRITVVKEKARAARNALQRVITAMKIKLRNSKDYSRESSSNFSMPVMNQENRAPHFSVQVTNKINIKNKMYYSDVFFCHEVQSIWKNNVILLAINRLATEQDWQDSQEVGCRIVAIGAHRFNVYKNIEKYDNDIPSLKLPQHRLKNYKDIDSSLETQFLNIEYTKYHSNKKYWRQLIVDLQIRVFVSEVIWNNQHIPFTDALEESGGISAFWQRSFQEFPSPESLVSADIMFGWSDKMALIKDADGSRIKYNVAVGYLGDHRAELLKPKAANIRRKLLDSGAKKIFVFFDEAFGKDSRWWIGYDVFRRNYEFLLRKLLANEWMGLVIKPKKPEFLEEDLKDIFPLLNEAMKTNRLHLFKEPHFPPCGAALSGDIAVGTDLYSMTAVVESVVAGIPTLVLNNEPFNMSQIYKNGKDRVVFDNWDDLWNYSIDNMGKGDLSRLWDHWSFFLDDVDPFRDGKSAYRMGTYLQWLIQGFERGENRETIMADAAEKYAKQWGEDKVITLS